MYPQVNILNGALRVTSWSHLRSISQINAKTLDCNEQHAAGHSKEWANAKPFSEIPGPTKFDLFRGFLPGGVFYNKPFDKFVLQNRKMYGDLIMIPSMFGKGSVLITFDPEDFKAVVRSEGQWPQRRGLETMTYYRTVKNPQVFGEVTGLLLSNGEKWGNLRSAVNPVLMQPRNAKLYVNKLLEVNNEFLQRIREIRDPNSQEMPENFVDDINRLTFESVAVVAVNQQIGLIRKHRDSEETQILFSSLKRIFDLSYELDVAPSIWKIVKTPKFYELMRHYDVIYDIIIKYINQSLERIENNTSSTNENEEKSVFEKLLKINKNVAVVMAFDMLMAGVDTTTTALVGILLGIAKNPEKQEKLREELRGILPQKDSQLTLDNMKNLTYLRACIKEGLRVHPVTSGPFRSNGEDIVLSGYQVPKRQDIMLCGDLIQKEDRYYANAKEYMPERWLRDGKTGNAINPFLNIPFGFGARSCVGRRLVDLELEITVARLVRNFNIEFNYSTDNAFRSRLINMPDIPLKFKFSEVVD